MKSNKILITCILLIVFFVISFDNVYSISKEYFTQNSVKIKNEGSYYNVVLNYNKKCSRKKMGENFTKVIIKEIPNYENLIDSYLSDVIPNSTMYNLFLNRSKDIIPQIKKPYLDELKGMSSIFSENENILGDGKLSVDEFYLLNLVPDVLRGTQCCAVSAYGERTQNNGTLTGRILDWYSGSQNQLAKIQCVITIKNKSKSICSLGYLGYMGIISGFNDNGIFAAILDSSTGSEYSSTGKNPYTFDLRYALENKDTLDDVGEFMISEDRSYTFGHLIFLSDKETSKVVENNISKNPDSIRCLRDENTILNDGVTWDIKDSVATVNSYLSKGNQNNHTPNLINTARWESIKNQISNKVDTISFDEMKDIMSYYTGDYPNNQALGDLYSSKTQQVIVFEPKTFKLEISFRPINNQLPAYPDFNKINVNF